MKVEQIKATLSDPADIRDVEFLLRSLHDVEDFLEQTEHFMDDQGTEAWVGEADLDRLEQFISFCVNYSNMRAEKILREYESYKMSSSFISLLGIFIEI